MSKLRAKLTNARAAYQSSRYEGNLANDVLSSRPSIAWRIIGVALAAVAAIAMVVWIMPGNLRHRQIVQIDLPETSTEVAPTGENSIDDSETETVALAVESIPSMPEFGSLWEADDQVTESSENWVPSFPTMDQLTQVTTQTVEDPS